MTTTQALLGFAVVAGLLTVTPGLDTALVLRSALAHGRRHAAATGAGVCLGVLVWGAAAAAGVSGLLSASTVAYDVLRVAGAAYLVWLGVALLRRRDHAEERAVTPGAWRGFRQGLLTNLLNPKVGAFYVAVLPQFLPEGVPPLLMGLALAGIHALLGTAWFAALIVLAARMRRALQRPRARRLLDAITGTVLVGFGLRLALTRA